ncbi:MAG TPA: hypothetical protein VN458_09780 [Solirubrobacterales bacterium]|nr:hypothetical protein [Solirubrobacterales bacterium]
MRKVVAAGLFMIAGAVVLLTVMTFANLWDSYQDSPDSLYITAGAIEAAVAASLVGLGAWLLRGR